MRRLVVVLCMLAFVALAPAAQAQQSEDKDKAVEAYTGGSTSPPAQPAQGASTTTNTTLPPNAPAPPAQVPEEEDDNTTAGFDTGIDGLYRGEDLKDGNSPNLPEAYPTGAYSINTDLSLTNMIGKAVNGGVSVIVTWGISLWSFDIKLMQDNMVNGPPGGIGQAGDNLVKALGGGILTPWLPLALALAMVGFLVHFQQNRLSALPFDFAWVCGIMALIFFLFAAYPTIRQTAVAATRAPGLALLKPLAALEKPSDAPASSEVVKPTYHGDETKAGLRIMADKTWRGLVMPFYNIIQFGSFQAGDKYAERWLASKTFTPTAEEKEAIASLYMNRGQDPPAKDPAQRAIDAYSYSGANQQKAIVVNNALQRHRDNQNRLKDEINQDPATRDFFKGKWWAERAVLAVLFLLIVGIIGLIVLWVVFVSWVFVAGFELLAMLWPIFILPMLYPGAGRSWAMNYLKLLRNLLIGAAVLTAGPIIVLVLITVLVSSVNDSAHWFMSIMGGLATLTAMVIFRGKIREIFADTHRPEWLRSHYVQGAYRHAGPAFSMAGAALMLPRAAAHSIRRRSSPPTAEDGGSNGTAPAGQQRPGGRKPNPVPRIGLPPVRGIGTGTEPGPGGKPSEVFADGAVDPLAPAVAAPSRAPKLPPLPASVGARQSKPTAALKADSAQAVPRPPALPAARRADSGPPSRGTSLPHAPNGSRASLPSRQDGSKPALPPRQAEPPAISKPPDRPQPAKQPPPPGPRPSRRPNPPEG